MLAYVIKIICGIKCSQILIHIHIYKYIYTKYDLLYGMNEAD